MRFLGRFFSCLVAVTITCTGRIASFPQPEEVFRKAEVVCVAVAANISPAEEKGFKERMPVRRMKARLRVTATLKGRTEEEIEFLYWTLDRGVVRVDGPYLVSLKTGERARFYLKKSGAQYVNAYDGEYDEGFTVDILSRGEPDRSLPMKRASAIKIAHEFLQAKGLSRAYDGSRALSFYRWGWGLPSSWQIIFLRARGFSGSSGTGPAVSIVVTSDGRIDEAGSQLRSAPSGR